MTTIVFVRSFLSGSIAVPAPQHWLERACAVASLPGILLAWVQLVLTFFQTELPTPQMGMGRAGLALVLLVPAVVYWSRGSHLAVDRGQVLRTLSVFGTLAALVFARFDIIVPGLPAVVMPPLILTSAVCLGPALYEWMIASPWKTTVPLQRMGATASSVRQLQLYDAVVVLGLPLLFLFTAPIQLFFPPGWVDAGMYLGLALDFVDMIQNYGWNYHALRVSYVLPASFVHSILPPVPARLLIVTAFYIGGLFSLYTGVRLLWGRVAATVAVATLAYNPVYVMAVTAGYVDGAYIAYILAFFAALVAWTSSGNIAWLVAGGAFAGLAVLAHAMAAAPILLMAMFFAMFSWDRLIAQPLRVFGAGLLGIAAVWLSFVYALSSVDFGIGAFHTLNWIVTASINGIGAKYREPIADWLPVTTRWLTPVLVLVATLLVFRPWTRGEITRRTWAVVMLALVVPAFFPLYDVVTAGSISQSAFYAGLLLPGSAVVNGAIAAALYRRATEYKFIVVAIVTVPSFAAIWMGPWLWSLAATLAVPVTLQAFCFAGIAVAAFLAVAGRLDHRLGIAAGLVAFISLQSLAGVFNRDTRHVFRLPGAIDNREFFRASIFVRQLITPDQLGGNLPMFWFNRTGFLTRDGRPGPIRPIRFGDQQLALTYFDSLASLRLWDRALFLAELGPDTRVERAKLLEMAGRSLVIVGTSPAAAAHGHAVLGRARVACKNRHAAIFESVSFALHVTIIDVMGDRDDGNVGCED